MGDRVMNLARNAMALLSHCPHGQLCLRGTKREYEASLARQ
jgi:hypothetical protein